MEAFRAETIKTLGGTLLGLTLLITGETIYSNNGYYSSILFLSGTILIPAGLLVLATALTGGFGQSPRALVEHYRRRQDKS